MSLITLTAQQFAELLRAKDVVMVPVSVSGFVYGVVRGVGDENIYRVAVA